MMAAERYGRIRPVLLGAVALMTVVQLLFAAVHGFWAIVAVLLLFFVAFNVLEAMQPSLVSRYAAASRGAALGVYNTTQAMGLFLGGAIGGWLLQHEGRSAVFLGCAVVLVLWLIIAWSMNPPPARGRDANQEAAH